MPRVNRNEIFADDEIQVFHLVNRCVRRTFLCGKDNLTGRDFSHRKQWVRNRMEELAGIFGVEVLGFAVMSNHLKVAGAIQMDFHLPPFGRQLLRRSMHTLSLQTRH